MKSFDEGKKSLKLFFPCNQNTFCFCWLKRIFCRFKLSIHIFLSRLKSNLSWSELTRLEPEPEFFFSSTRTRPDPKSQPDASLNYKGSWMDCQRFLNVSVVVKAIFFALYCVCAFYQIRISTLWLYEIKFTVILYK